MSRRRKKPQSIITRIHQFLASIWLTITTYVLQVMLKRKEARKLKKQSKVVAEYKLMAPESKRIKLDDGGERKLLDPEQFKLMKKELAERKRLLTQLPRFNLTTLGSDSTTSTDYTTRTPLLLADIQHLITYAYGGNALIPPPRWCVLQKPNRLVQLVVVLVEGLGLNEFVDNEHLLPRTMKLFGGATTNRCVVEVLDPQWYGATMANEVARWGLFQYGSTEDKDPIELLVDQLSSVFAITKEAPSAQPNQDKFPRTKLVLSLPQLIQESYPLPIPSNPMSRDTAHKMVQTAREYAPVHAGSPMFAIDCEMCGAVGDPNALVKIGVVDEELKTVYESFVRPKNKIIDYRTRWSGITPQMLEGVETRLKDVQEKIKGIVEEHPDCIFVGQSLNCDLNALRMIHPYVIDTSVCFNLTGIEGRKSKLRDLALNLLDEVIQGKHDKEGHCPVEDAQAAMKLVRAKLANDISFGNAAKNSNSVAEPVVETLNNCFKERKNTLDKDVLVITHTPTTSGSSSSDDEETTHQTPVRLPLLYHKLNNKPPGQEQSRITVKQSSCNRATMKMLSSHLFDNHMSVAHYKLNSTKLLSKEIVKLDKRLQKLCNRTCDNSMVVVVCTSEGVKSESEARRNNGVCLVRVKVGEVKRRRVDS